MKLHGKQNDAFTAGCKALESGQPSVLTMATGTGKTVVGSALIGEMHRQGKRGLWIVDRRNLVNQAEAAIRANVPGLSIGVEMGASRAGSLPIYDLIVGTSQSVSARLDSLPPLDYAVVDEAHTDCHSNDHSKIYEHLKGKPRIGLSATPFDETGKDMLSYGKWSNYCFKYPLLSAVEDGVLCPIRAKVVELEGVDLRNIDFNKDELSKKDQDEIERQLIQEERLHMMAGFILEMPTPGIIFCPTINHSAALAKVLNKYDKNSTIHIDCYMQEHQDGSALLAFRKGTYKRACNKRLWCYGIDIPECELVVFCCDKNRQAYEQGIGRVSRWCCREKIFTNGKVCQCGRNKSLAWVLDFAGNVADYSKASLWGALAPEATERQLREMQTRSEQDPSKSTAQIVAEVLADVGLIESAQVVGSGEELDIVNPLAEIMDRARIVGFSLPPPLQNDSPPTRNQIETLQERFFYPHETRLRVGKWIDNLTESQARKLIETIERRDRSGRADPKLLKSLSSITKFGKPAFDRSVLSNMTQENAKLHWDRHRSFTRK